MNEAFVNDIYSGEIKGYIYEIPFALIASIEPIENESSRLTLRDGLVLELKNDRDNGGTLIFDGQETSVHRVPWSQITKVQFQP